jgi:hypothetical protein
VRSVKPRVRRSPRSAFNEVDDAVFLSAAYGLTPDDWQEDVLESWLGRRRDGRWAAATCGLAVARQNGKNGIIEIRELFGMIALGEKFLHTAHEVKTARKAFLRIASFFENPRQYPELAALAKEIRKTNGQEAVVLTNGGSVEFIARSKGSGRGYTVDVIVCDEAQDMAAEELAALLPTISAAPLGNPQVIFTGTPPKPGRGEVFAQVRADGQAGRDARLAWTDFGVADGPLPDIEDRALWYQTNPALGGRLNIAEVERELSLMRANPDDFAAERLGWWGDPAHALGAAFGPGAWEDCGNDGLTPIADAIGLAVSIDRAWASIGAAGRSGDLVTIGVADRREGAGWLVPEAQRIQADRNCAVVIAGTGPAADLIPALEAAGVRLTIAKGNDAADACAGIFDAVREKRLAHPKHPELDAAVAGAQRRKREDRWVWDRRNSAHDISPLEAVTLALWAANNTTGAFFGAWR